MPDWFAPVVSVIALALSILGPVVSNFFALRNAAQERKMTERRERRQELTQKLDQLIEARSHLGSEIGNSTAGLKGYGKACAIMFSISDHQMQELASQAAEVETPRNPKLIDQGIKRLGEILSQEIK